MHKQAPAIAAATSSPLPHIVDSTAAAIREAGLDTVGLPATRFTREESFYRDRQQHGFRVLIPEENDREIVHRVIYDEL